MMYAENNKNSNYCQEYYSVSHVCCITKTRLNNMDVLTGFKQMIPTFNKNLDRRTL